MSRRVDVSANSPCSAGARYTNHGPKAKWFRFTRGRRDRSPSSEGWRFQRDTAAYAGLYNADTTGRWPPPGSGRQITAEALKEKLDEAHRYRDHRPAFIRSAASASSAQQLSSRPLELGDRVPGCPTRARPKHPGDHGSVTPTPMSAGGSPESVDRAHEEEGDEPDGVVEAVGEDRSPQRLEVQS
jgi:hypothetical protein